MFAKVGEPRDMLFSYPTPFRVCGSGFVRGLGDFCSKMGCWGSEKGQAASYRYAEENFVIPSPIVASAPNIISLYIYIYLY